MTPLANVTQAFDTPEGFSVPADWRQGRTVYGGLSAALSLQALLNARGGELPALRAAQVNYIGPATEALRFGHRLLRQGKTATWVEADCTSADALAMRAMFLFANERPSAIVHERAERPRVEPPQAHAPMPLPGGVPSFFANFEIRFAGRALPVSGSDHPELLAWVRHRDATGVHPAVALVALADALPPAAMASFTQFAPISTMTWSFELRALPAPGQWFLMRSSSLRAAAGCSVQQMDIWDEAGAPVLAGLQTVALFA